MEQQASRAWKLELLLLPRRCGCSLHQTLSQNDSHLWEVILRNLSREMMKEYFATRHWQSRDNSCCVNNNQEMLWEQRFSFSADQNIQTNSVCWYMFICCIVSTILHVEFFTLLELFKGILASPVATNARQRLDLTTRQLFAPWSYEE